MEAAQEIQTDDSHSEISKQGTSAPGRTVAMFLIAVAVLFAICWKCYGQCCGIGFTLDEFGHVPYVYQAFHGHPEALLAKLYSSFTDVKIVGLASYRPLTALSFAGDYIFWGTNAFGWHFDTLLSFFAMCIVSGLLVYELLKRVWTSSYAAFAGAFTSLLMILYPGHPDSAVTIVGRHDCMAAGFAFASIYLYAIAAASKRQTFFRSLSLISFLLGLASKEIAVTVPVALCIGEGLKIFSPSENQTLKSRLLRTLPFWLLLAVFGVVRTLCLHSVVGGYGGGQHLSILRQLMVFGDVDTLRRIFIPLNEHFPLPDIFVTALGVLYSYPLARLISRCLKSAPLAKVIAFFLLFALLNMLPSFQIWHIFPNMVGARLFIISSITVAALFAIALTPTSKHFAINCLDVGWAVALVFAWNIALANNLIAFEHSGALMQGFRSQIKTLIEITPKDKYLTVARLPMDYCGAPMLGKANFLKTSLQPPFTETPSYSKVVVIEGGKLIYLSEKPDYSIDLGSCPIYLWSNDAGEFIRLHKVTSDAAKE